MNKEGEEKGREKPKWEGGEKKDGKWRKEPWLLTRHLFSRINVYSQPRERATKVGSKREKEEGGNYFCSMHYYAVADCEHKSEGKKIGSFNDLNANLKSS